MPNFDFAVFGAGLAGLAVSRHLLNQNKTVLLIDPNGAGGGASGAPAGLVNPAAARRAKMTWRAEQCHKAILENLQRLQAKHPRERLYKSTGVLRPAITEELAENFERAITEYNWPEGWVSWLNETETEAINPDIAPNFGGLFVHSGLSVYMDQYCQNYLQDLQEQGLTFWNEQTVYQSEENKYTLINKNRKSAVAQHLIVCAGANTSDFEEWQNLNIHSVKGELAVFEMESEPAWDHAVSALGYLTLKGNTQIIVGSTYDHHYQNLEPTEKGRQILTEKLGNMLPDISGAAETTGRWSGVRCTAPNRLPVIGTHPILTNMHIFTALGSKGLLFSEYIGKLLADHLVSGADIPEELNVNRFISK